MAIPKKTAPYPLGPRLSAGPFPSHMALRAARRSMRSAISWLLIDPPHTHENSASSSLERSKNRCASSTLSPVKPASRRALSLAASANAELGCARYFHSPASRYSRLMKRWSGTPGPDHVGKALQSLALGHWRGSDGDEGLVHGLLIRQMSAMDKQGYQDLCSSQLDFFWSHET